MTTEVSATLDIGALHLELGNLSKAVKELRDDLALLNDDLDVNGAVTYSTTAGVNQNYIDLGHPSAGKKWNVRSIQIAGTDITSTPAGVGWILVQAVPPTANPSIVTVQDWTKAALPQNSFYGRGELVVRQMEHLFVLILGGTNNTLYTASASVQSFPEFVRAKP